MFEVVYVVKQNRNRKNMATNLVWSLGLLMMMMLSYDIEGRSVDLLNPAGGAGSANAGAQGVLGPATSASSGGGRTCENLIDGYAISINT